MHANTENVPSMVQTVPESTKTMFSFDKHLQNPRLRTFRSLAQREKKPVRFVWRISEIIDAVSMVTVCSTQTRTQRIRVGSLPWVSSSCFPGYGTRVLRFWRPYYYDCAPFRRHIIRQYCLVTAKLTFSSTGRLPLGIKKESWSVKQEN